MRHFFWRLLIATICCLAVSVWKSTLDRPVSGDSIVGHFGLSSAAASITPILSGAVISGLPSISTGQCTAFRITAIDQNGHPFRLSQNTVVFLRRLNASSVAFSLNPSCAKPLQGFSMSAGAASRVFYAIDNIAEGAGVQPILNPRTTQRVLGASFEMLFAVNGPPSPTPTATPTPPSKLQVTSTGCWLRTGGNSYQALSFQLGSPATLILQGEMYDGPGCVPANFTDQLNDFNRANSFGTFGYIFWFNHRPNETNVSVVWSFSDTGNNLLWSSGCIDYNTAPPC